MYIYILFFGLLRVMSNNSLACSGAQLTRYKQYMCQANEKRALNPSMGSCGMSGDPSRPTHTPWGWRVPRNLPSLVLG
jgi:hypothetical protein